MVLNCYFKQIEHVYFKRETFEMFIHHTLTTVKSDQLRLKATLSVIDFRSSYTLISIIIIEICR